MTARKINGAGQAHGAAGQLAPQPPGSTHAHLYHEGFIAPHTSIRKDAVDVDAFVQEHPVYTKEYLTSISPGHRNPATWYEMMGWYWHLAVMSVISMMTGTWSVDSYTETSATWRILFFTSAGQAGAAVAALCNHLRSVVRNQPDNGWVHTALANAECLRVHAGILAMASHVSVFTRAIGLMVQVALFWQFLPIYLLAPSVFHAYCAYRAEEQMFNYSIVLKLIRTGRFATWRGMRAPPLAASYYGLRHDATTLEDAFLRMRADEACIQHIDITFAGLRPGARNPFVTVTEASSAGMSGGIVRTREE